MNTLNLHWIKDIRFSIRELEVATLLEIEVRQGSLNKDEFFELNLYGPRDLLLAIERGVKRELDGMKTAEEPTEAKPLQGDALEDLSEAPLLRKALEQIAASSKRSGPPDIQYWIDVANDRRDIARAALG